MISDERLRDLVLLSGDAEWLTTIKEMAQELLIHREAAKKTDALMDSQYIAGAKMGWNCGVANESGKFLMALKNRRDEIVEVRNENQVKKKSSASKEGPEYKAIFFGLIASLHLSLPNSKQAALEDIIESLRQVGIPEEKLSKIWEPYNIIRGIPTPAITLRGEILESEESEE